MAEEEEGKALPWPDGAEKVEDPTTVEFLMCGNKSKPIMKFELDRLNELVEVNGESMPAIQGGTTAAAAVALPAGPTGQNRWFDASWGYWKYNNTVLKNPLGTDGIPQGNDGMLYWNGTTETWSISKIQELPSVNVNNGFSSSATTEPGSAKNDKVLNDQLNVGIVTEVPNGYKIATYNSRLTRGYSYYDSRCIVTDKTKFKSVNVVVRQTSGNINLLALSLNGDVLRTETKAVIIGVNELTFDDISTVNEPFVVGLQLILNQAEVATNLPADGDGFSFWKQDGVASWSALTFRIGYSINLITGGIVGRMDGFQILIKSDTTKIQQNLLKSNKVVLDSTPVTIEDKIEVPNGATLEGVFGKSIIKLGSGITTEAFNIQGKEDINIRGIKIVGSQPNYSYSMNGINSGTGIIANSTEALSNTYMGNEIGMLVKSSENVVIENIDFYNISGVGFIGDYVGRNYIKGMRVSKLFFANCYKGLETRNEHEYSSYTDLMVSLCQIGVDINSGNLSFNGLTSTRCRYGAIFRGDGINHAHGQFSGSQIKHHQLAGLLIDNVTNGQKFSGLFMQYANLVIQDSIKVSINDLDFSNGSITCTNASGKVGKNIITSLNRLGTITLNNPGNLTILHDNNLSVS